MRWTERQRDLLEAIGVRLWLPPTPEPPSTRSSPLARADATTFDGAEARAAPHATVPVAKVSLPATSPSMRQSDRSLPSPTPTPRPRAPQAEAPASADERSAAIERMPWDALQAAVAGCSACGLCRTRRQTVFGVGHPNAHWMIVGEAPGRQEDERGEPFVGDAGRLLDRMLAALGLSREPGDAPRQVFIANALKCRPPGNRNPEPDEMALCRPFLRRQVALIRPRIILAMGAFAVKSLLGSNDAIGRLRGRAHAFAGVPLVVTYHPAYLLRQLADKARAWDDLCLAARIAEEASRNEAAFPGTAPAD